MTGHCDHFFGIVDRVEPERDAQRLLVRTPSTHGFVREEATFSRWLFDGILGAGGRAGFATWRQGQPCWREAAGRVQAV